MSDNKKGLSPVIATVLLIMLAIILAVIIIIWATSFIGERITKDLGAGEEEISKFCEGEDLSFVLDVYRTNDHISLTAQNNGNVPIYGFEIRQKKTFSVKKIIDISFGTEGLLSGDTKTAEGTSQSTLSGGDKVIVVPVLAGEAKSGRRYYTCDDKFGQEVVLT